MQAPDPLQVSRPLQTFPSEQDVPAASGVWLTPVTGLQASAVQGFPSLTRSALPGWQTPEPLQISSPLQTFPSEHDVPAATAVCVTTPVVALQASVVHGLPSSTAFGVPAQTELIPVHWSLVVQALLSLQTVPFGL
jgi:hypothetical protein